MDLSDSDGILIRNLKKVVHGLCENGSIDFNGCIIVEETITKTICGCRKVVFTLNRKDYKLRVSEM